jgi:spore maturation protein B
MFLQAVQEVSNWAIPFLLCSIPLYGYINKVDIFNSFVEGAEGGFKTGIKLIPFLVGMLFALNIFRASGAMDAFLELISPITSFLPIPPDVLPLAMLRPISGSGAMGVLVDIIEHHGPDSFIGKMACTMQGSTDTTFFVLTVYFGSVGIKKTRHALATGLLADAVGFLAAVFISIIAFK